MDRITTTALTPAACSAAPWRTAGAWWITVMVKGTFRLVPGEAAQLVAPLALVREDRHRASGSLEAASETAAPYLPGAGVMLTGHAYPPGGRPGTAAAARLAIGREKPLLDKTLYAYGDRIGAGIQPFDKMPLVYERTYGGPSTAENPVGLGASGTAPLPNLYDVHRSARPAGFGPISRTWPVRKRLLGTFDERALHAPEPEIPAALDWRYFHAAPPDQQIDALRGDEWIVLDGMHPTLARIQTRLPSAIGRAKWHRLTSSGPGAGTAVELVADTLVIDADRLLCSIVWRGRFALERPEMASWVSVSAGIELPGQPITWPDAQDPGRAALELAQTSMAFHLPREAMPPGLFSPASNPAAATSVLDLRAMGVTVLPFSSKNASEAPAPAPAIEARRPVVERASDSVSGTASLDFQQMIKAIVPFRPAAPPLPLSADPAATGAMDGRRLRAALPFSPDDPSRPVFAAVPQPALPRAPSSLGATADPDMQRAIRAAMPFARQPQPAPGAVAPVSVPVLPVEQPARLPEPAPPAPVFAPPTMQAPPLMQMPLIAAAPPPMEMPTPPVAVSVPAPPPAPSPVAPSAPIPSTTPPPGAAPLEAPPAEEPVNLREQIFERLHARASLQGLPLGGADLQDFDFSGASLAGLDFRRANLRRANLSGAHAAEIQLEGADLTEAILDRADLARANLTRADVTQARFDGATLTGANLQRLSGDAPSFRTAKLQGADLRQASLPGAKFDEAVMIKASSAKADYSGARFVGADLSGANLRDCKLREADFSRANLDSTDLRDADVSRAKLDSEARKTAKLTPPQVKSLGDNKI
jgi:uncharacterized protein YjbI with pentapeptide repeats